MVKIKQNGIGRKSSGTLDGITYVTRKGVTYARSTPSMPRSAFKTPAALKRQAVFKLIQMHLKYHLRTIRQTFTPKGTGTPSNRYYSVNHKALALALEALAEQYVAGENVTLTDVNQPFDLTFRIANASDWWFHSKKAPGSHVIARRKDGQELPDHIFELAAGAAAYYSSARDADKVEIDYVQRREVKKPNGSKPGFVVYYTNYSMTVRPDISKLSLVP